MDFPSIALLTDFGDRDGFVGVMKGVILANLSQPVPLVDLSHRIASQDIRHAMWVLENTYAYFPGKTIFVSVVDPAVGNVEQAMLLAYWPQRQQIFIAPDNGLLTPIYEAAAHGLQVYDIRQSSLYQADRLSQRGRSQTFHGRDVYAPVAALTANALLAGELPKLLAQFGPTLPLTGISPIHLHRQKPRRINDRERLTLLGEIVAHDHFGNLITNIPNHWAEPGEQFSVSINQNAPFVCFCQPTYSTQATPQAESNPVRLIPSSGGTLELAIFLGSAQTFLQARPGFAITLNQWH